MSFDDEVDELKKELVENHNPEEHQKRTTAFYTRLVQTIKSRRLKYDLDLEGEEGPGIDVYYAEAPFFIGTINVYPAGNIVFSSESDYFPSIAPFDDEDEFFKEARDFLKLGLAAFELDEEAENDTNV